MNRAVKKIYIEHRKYPLAKVEDATEKRLVETYGEIKDDTFHFKFSGLISSGKALYIVMPKTYVIPNNNEKLREDASNLYKALIRYKQESYKIDLYEEKLLGNIGEDNNMLAVMHTIINNYCEKGLLLRKQRRLSSLKNGQIHWGKTVDMTLPIIKNNSPIYFETFNKHKVQDDELIVKIHSYIVNECLSLLGWFIAPSTPCKNLESEPPCDHETALAVINKELAKTYSDMDLFVLKTLKEYLTGSGDVERGKFITLATPNFHFVWEKACRDLFPHTVFSNKFLKTHWITENKKDVIVQRPDITFKDRSLYYIIDAKYYDLNNNRPGWHDVVKQLFYQSTFKNEKDTTVINIMLFPDMHKDLFKYIGHSETEHFEKMYGITGNLFDILSIYASRTNRIKLKELKEVLNNVIKH